MGTNTRVWIVPKALKLPKFTHPCVHTCMPHTIYLHMFSFAHGGCVRG
jgi:hypothetical protein